jgi:hypothetical protein
MHRRTIVRQTVFIDSRFSVRGPRCPVSARLIRRRTVHTTRGPSAEDDDMLDAPVVRELLCVLFDVRAHVGAIAAQLARAHPQLERLDARRERVRT